MGRAAMSLDGDAVSPLRFMVMNLQEFTRVRLGHWPTPLEPMKGLARRLNAERLFIKRDDCTGLATGGSKTRKLEFLVGEAIHQGADTLLTCGAVQSNHVRQTAAAAAFMGLACEAILEERVQGAPAAYHESGNVLLDHLFGIQNRSGCSCAGFRRSRSWSARRLT